MFNLKSTLCGALLVAPLLFSGCYPEKPGSISEYDIVYTVRSPSFDFKAANTYSLPDSIVLITGDLAEGDFVLFRSMGAYSVATNTRFNGFGDLTIETVLSLG